MAQVLLPTPTLDVPKLPKAAFNAFLVEEPVLDYPEDLTE
jgi:hypothetical protein